MLIGGLIGGGSGVLIGGAVGADRDHGHWLAKHRSATMPAGTELTLELNRPMTMGAVPAPAPAPAVVPPARQARAAAASKDFSSSFANQDRSELAPVFEFAPRVSH